MPDLTSNPDVPAPSCCTAGRSAAGSASQPGPQVTSETLSQASSEPASTQGMVRVPGGAFLMGADHPDGIAADGEAPVREVEVASYFIDTCVVTNRAFAAFVKATGYRTEAERFGWSYVFQGHLPKKYAESLRRTSGTGGQTAWWIAVPEATWRQPFGPRSDLRGKDDHPVVQVSWNDAAAYAAWIGKRLPTEAEWECAARGGRAQTRFPWGDQLEPRGKHRCNVWQGKFPEQDTAADGYAGTCPVDTFAPNDLGLHNVCGNVWEWCADWFSPTWRTGASPDQLINPQGPAEPEPVYGRPPRRVQKGGSYLCHRSYCNRYRLGARTGNEPDSATTNAGFRCVRDV